MKSFDEVNPDWWKPGDIKTLTRNEVLDLLTLDVTIGVLFDPYRLMFQEWKYGRAKRD